jgi:drug/metabolite transporter (DMT)-like permease
MGGLFVIISSLFYGFSNAYWKRATANLPFFILIFCRGLLTSTVFGTLWLIEIRTGIFGPYVGQLKTFTLQQLTITISLCLMSGFGLYFFVKSMQGGIVNLVAPLSSLNIFGLLTATFVLGEPWKTSYWLPIAIMTMGLLLLFFSKQTLKLNQTQKKAMGYGLLAALIWGFDYTLFKIPIKWMGVLPFCFLLEISITFFSFCLVMQHKLTLKPYLVDKKNIKNTFILAFCLLGGSLFMHIAYLSTSIAQINFFAQTQLIFTLLFGAILYKNQLALRQWLGILLLIISIVLIAVK